MNSNPLGFYKIDHPLLAVGFDTLTFNMGKIIPIRIQKAEKPEHSNIYGPKYLVRYTGDAIVCLDMGENWFLTPGDLFECHQHNIDAALIARRYGSLFS